MASKAAIGLKGLMPSREGNSPHARALTRGQQKLDATEI